MNKMKLIGALVAVLLGIVVILQNTNPVETRLLVFSFTMPNAILLGLTLLIGIAVGMLLSLSWSHKKE